MPRLRSLSEGDQSTEQRADRETVLPLAKVLRRVAFPLDSNVLSCFLRSRTSFPMGPQCGSTQRVKEVPKTAGKKKKKNIYIYIYIHIYIYIMYIYIYIHIYSCCSTSAGSCRAPQIRLLNRISKSIFEHQAPNLILGPCRQRAKNRGNLDG